MHNWIAALVMMALTVTANGQETPFVQGDVLVMLRAGADVKEVVRDLGTLEGDPTDLRAIAEVSAPMRTWLLRFDAQRNPHETMRRAIASHPLVLFAQNDHFVKERSLPNDPQFSNQWQHVNINSAAAWDVTTGGTTATNDTIVVCIIERSDLTHPDLAANAWNNAGEIADNDVDDDGNGYVDDKRGWNTPNGDDNVYGSNHGTQVAGMIGAVGNNGLGVAGANWNVKLMPVAYGSAVESAVVAAYTYPLVMRRRYNESNGATGAFVAVTNASWGIDAGQPANSPIWCAMFDSLGAEGILNCASTANNNVDVDIVGDLPTACGSEYLISVTATNQQDQRTFSGYGATTIDVAAPGASVYTTSQGGGFGNANGTSFAAPLTAGVVALLYSAPCPSLMQLVHTAPDAGAAYVRDILFNGVDQVGNLPGTIATGGRVNAGTSMQQLMQGCGDCPAPFGLQVQPVDVSTVSLQWTVITGSPCDVRYREVGATDWMEISAIDGSSVTLEGLAACVLYEYQARVHCGGGSSEYSASFVWTSEGCCSAPTGISIEPSSVGVATITWSPVIGASNFNLRYRTIGTIEWTEITDIAATTTELVALGTCINYEMQLASNCNGSLGVYSESVLFLTPGCGTCIDNAYCSSQGNDSSTEWIARVACNDLDHSSGNDGGYGNHTDQSCTLIIGGTQNLLLQPGYSTFAYSEWWSVWLDLDQDGSFSDAERLYESSVGMNTTANVQLVVPADAVPGNTRMRVSMKYGSNAGSPCGSYANGETEDYCVDLVVGIGMEERSASTASVFPNPASDRLHVNGLRTGGTKEVRLIDALGRTVSSQRTTTDRAVVDLSTLEDSTYLLEVLTDGVRTSVSRIVVQR